MRTGPARRRPASPWRFPSPRSPSFVKPHLPDASRRFCGLPPKSPRCNEKCGPEAAFPVCLLELSLFGRDRARAFDRLDRLELRLEAALEQAIDAVEVEIDHRRDVERQQLRHAQA